LIAIDTNILVYAHREDSSWHEAADRCLMSEAESGTPWAIPWPCIHEFLAIVTHPRIYDPPTPPRDALEQVHCWLEVPTVVMLAETAGYWQNLHDLLDASRVVGPRATGRLARFAPTELQPLRERDLERLQQFLARPLLAKARTPFCAILRHFCQGTCH
jgi:uncharacterized protein